MRALFRGAFIDEWVTLNEDNIACNDCDRNLLKKSVFFYHEFWKERCEYLHTEEKQ